MFSIGTAYRKRKHSFMELWSSVDIYGDNFYAGDFIGMIGYVLLCTLGGVTSSSTCLLSRNLGFVDMLIFF